ncbi:hypothetical protein GCM10010211_81280 [Streptomyces albospinus]|uniref:Transcriptional regulator n=1 Tax=Streptomyces albospinus TaxID=285515 RepID=A0ABQ2VNI8_9ACTN|nr:hypothetical protein [Streptomyces albospinus]GGV01742.1 hypothetical protein GCM10010211_81280 [Streptomyces albospinus]
MPNDVAVMPISPEERFSRLDPSQDRTGGELLALEFDCWAEGTIPPFTTAIGMKVRLRYATWGACEFAWLKAAGLDVSSATVDGWKRGTRLPDSTELKKINDAFWLRRRADLAPVFKDWLCGRGRGRHIEIWPCEGRDLPMEEIWVQRRWRSIVDAWSENDLQRLEGVWRKMTRGLGVSADDYVHVYHVAFGAGLR